MNVTPLKRLALVGLGGLLIALFFALDVDGYLTLTALKENRQVLTAFTGSHYLTAVLAFMAVYIAQTALSLPGSAILSLAAGALFGSLAGTVYAVISATLGATLAFLVSRYLLRDWVLDRFGARLAALNRELETRGFSYLLFLRLVPVFPFFLINLAAGLTRLPLSTYVAATLIGIIPGGFVYVNAGASLATIDSLAGIASPRVLGSFVLLGLFALVPIGWSKWKARHEKSSPG